MLESRPDRIDHHIKRKAREDRHRAVAESAWTVAFDDRVFSLVYCDPPWSFETYAESGKDGKSADNHYACMGFEALAAVQYGDRPICRIAADDAVIFLWATPPMLEHALALARVWRFEYRSSAHLGEGSARHGLLGAAAA